HLPKMVDNDPEILKLDPDLPRAFEEYFDHVTWTRRYRSTGEDSTARKVEGIIHYQICGEGVCRKKTLTFAAVAGAEAQIATPPARGNAAQQVMGQVKPGIEGSKAAAVKATTGKIDKSQGLFLFLLAAAGSGFLALLTPC